VKSSLYSNGRGTTTENRDVGATSPGSSGATCFSDVAGITSRPFSKSSSGDQATVLSLEFAC